MRAGPFRVVRAESPMTVNVRYLFQPIAASRGGNGKPAMGMLCGAMDEDGAVRVTGGNADRSVQYEGSDLEALSVLTRYRAWIFDRVAPWLGGRAAELGAGIGAFSVMFADRAVSLDAVEPSASLHARLTAAVSRCTNVRVLDASNTIVW